MPINRQKESVAVSAVAAGLLDLHQDGSVWRIATRTRTGRIRAVTPQRCDRARPDGYRYVSVSVDGREFKVLVHRLMWLAARMAHYPPADVYRQAYDLLAARADKSWSS